MSAFTLDAIRSAAEAKYGSVDIELDASTTCRLLNPLKLPKENRDALITLQDELEAKGSDQQALLCTALALVAATAGESEALLAVIGDDLTLLAEVFETYGKATQVGEASASDD